MATTYLGPQERAQQLAEAAVRMGHDMESDRVAALGMLAGARAAMRLGRPALAARRLRSAVKILQPPTRLDTLDAHLVTALTHLDRGSWFDVGRSADELRSGVLANGWRLWEPLAPLLIGRAYTAGGEPLRAVAELDRAVSTARSVGATGTLPLARAVRDQALILSGRSPRSTPEAMTGSAELGAVRAENRGLVALRGGDAGAAEAFEQAVERWRELGVTASLARGLSMQAHADRRSGNPRRAARHARKAAEVLDTLKTPEAARGPLLQPIEPASGA
jgi:hypothetical protein